MGGAGPPDSGKALSSRDIRWPGCGLGHEVRHGYNTRALGDASSKLYLKGKLRGNQHLPDYHQGRDGGVQPSEPI